MKCAGKSFIGIVAVVFITCFPMGLAAEEAGDTAIGNLKSMIGDLEKAIQDADKKMVAHPVFLDELRALVERYKGKLRETFFFDDFEDGNYTVSPVWKVTSGAFSITRDKRLYSRVLAQRPASSSTSSSSDPQEPLGIILNEILKATTKSDGSRQESSTASAQTAEAASIQTVVRFAPAYEVDLSVSSDAYWGGMEIVLMGGSPARARYRLVYQAAPSKERPMELIRERDGRRYVIDSATKFPVLEDGKLHRIQWIRDINGNMKVLVDGQTVLSTVELYYRSEFTALALVNRGGTYQWGPIRIMQASREEAAQ